MILRALNDYYERLAADPHSGVAEYGFSRERIDCEIILDEDGGFTVNPLVSPDGDKERRGKKLLVPHYGKKRTANDCAYFTWDNTEYIFGVSDDEAAGERAARRFQLFKDLHLAQQDLFKVPVFEAFIRFIKSRIPGSADGIENFEAIRGCKCVFRLRNSMSYLHDERLVRAKWVRIRAETNRKQLIGRCLITGEIGPIADLHPAIKGVADPGGQAEKSLCAFNRDAFQSYGKTKETRGHNAAVVDKSAFQYVTALNRLLDRSFSRRLTIGDVSVVYWTDRPSPAEPWIAKLFDPSTEAEDETEVNMLRSILDAMTHGRFPVELGDPVTPFFVLGLSPNAARISVRFWYESTLGDFITNLGAHYARLEIDGLNRAPAPYRLIEQASRGSKDVPPNMAGEFLRSILHGFPYPRTILNGVLRRIRAKSVGEKDSKKDVLIVSPIQAALLKAILIRNEGVTMETYLNKEHPEPAYHCGRLFAVVAFAQLKALKSVNAGVVRRMMGGVMSAPGLMLGRLQRNAEVGHIPKLPSLGAFVRDELRAINVTLRDELPKTLNAVEQTIFALGYYQESTYLDFAGDQVIKNKRHRSENGEWMRSKLETKVAACLSNAGIHYIYEPSVRLPGDRERWPDFVVRGPEPAKDYYIEVCGYPGEEYEQRHQLKIKAYAELGVLPEGGPRGRLVVLDYRERDYEDRVVLDELRENNFHFYQEDSKDQ